MRISQVRKDKRERALYQSQVHLDRDHIDGEPMREAGKNPKWFNIPFQLLWLLKWKPTSTKKMDLPPFAKKLIGRLEKYEGMLLHKIMVQDCWEDRYKSYTRSSSVLHGTQSRLMPSRYGLPTIGGNQRRRSPNIRECGEHRAHSLRHVAMKDHKKAAVDSNSTRLCIELSFQQLRTIFDQSGKLIWSVKVNNPFPASGRKKIKGKKSCLSKMVHPRHLFSFFPLFFSYRLHFQF